MTKIKLVVFDKTFLDLTWLWLNDPEIKYLVDSPTITKEQQLEWFESLNKKEDYLIWGIKYSNVPVGVCGLKNITDESSEYWGYIGEKEFWGLGIGSIILDKMIYKAKTLKNKYIWLKVLNSNKRAIDLYSRKNFKILDKLSSGHLKMKLDL